jgi:Transposase, Mutator family
MHRKAWTRYNPNRSCGGEGHPFGEQALCSINWLADDQMTSTRVLSIANNEHRLADERVEGVGDRHFEGQTPGIMNSLRAWAARAPRPGALSSTISSIAGCGGPSFSSSTARPGLDKAIASVWDEVPVQRCTVHKHRNLFAHAPERLHDEITADYNDMICATHLRRSRPAARCVYRKPYPSC